MNTDHKAQSPAEGDELARAARELLYALTVADDGCTDGGLGPGYQNGHGEEVGTRIAAARAGLRAALAANPQPKGIIESCHNCDEGLRIGPVCETCGHNHASPAPAPKVPARWKFEVAFSDGRAWLNISSPGGASACLSATHKTGNGDDTIAAQVLAYLRDDLAATAVKAEAGERIDAAIAEWIETPTVYERAAFRKGFRAAERRYGIGSEPPVQGSEQ